MSLGELRDELVDAGNQTDYQSFQVLEKDAYLGCAQEYLEEAADDIEENGNLVKYSLGDRKVEVADYEDIVEISGEGLEAEVSREIADADNWLKARISMYKGIWNSIE